MIEAHKRYEEGQYDKALTLISQAESAGAMNEERIAKITFLKAQAYEGLGDGGRASLLYHYVQDQHPTSQYGYLARLKLESLP